MNKKLDQAFGNRRAKADEAADFISAAEEQAGKKPAHKSNGAEAVSARTMCLSLSVRQEEAIDRLSLIQRKSKAAVVREAIDAYLKRHQKELDKYDAFLNYFGNE